MRIVGLKINGFGLFYNQRVKDMPAGLCVFFGENETGKSTLLAFIRSILFGFPTARENKYEPLRGGNYGGSLTLHTDAGGEYTVRRDPSRKVAGEVSIMCPDGSIQTEDFMPNLLGSATRDLFESIFAFSLRELQELSKLTSENVKGVIYSAGAGSVGRSLPGIHADLEKRMGDIFKKGGSKPEINKVLRELDEVSRQLRKITDNSVHYGELQSELAMLEQDIAAAEKGREELALKLKGIENRLRAWDDWIALESARGALQDLPQVQTFPENGTAKLDNLQQRLSDARHQLSARERKRNAREKRLAETVVNEALIGQARTIRRLQKGRDRYDVAVKDLPVRRQELADKQKQLARALSELGPEWDREKLAAIDVSITKREAARRHEAALDEAREEERAARHSVDAAARLAEIAQKDAEEAREHLTSLPEPSEKDEQPILARIKHLSEASKLLVRTLRIGDSLDNFKERHADLEAQLLPLDAEAERPHRGFLLWLSYFVPVAGVAAAIRLFRESPALAIVVASICLIVGYIVFRARRRQREVLASKREQAKRMQTRLLDIQRRRATAEEELEGLQANMRQTLSYVGMDEDVNERGLERELTTTESSLEECRRWLQARAELEKSDRAVDKAKGDLTAAKFRQEKAVEALTSLEKGWARWLADAGLSDQLTPSGAQDVFSRVDACREIGETVQSLKERIGLIETDVQGYREDVSAVAKSCGRGLSGADDPGAFLDRLAEGLQREEDGARRRSKLEEDVSELGEEMDVLRGQLTELEENIARLFEDGGASDENAFRQRAEWHSRRLEFEQEIRRRSSALGRISGPGRLEQFLEVLGDSVREELEVGRDDLARQLERVGEQLEEGYDKRGSLKKEIEQLEVEEESSELRLKQQQLKAKLEQLARSWCVLRLSREILRQAQEVYERERQPDVIREASGLFDMITDGRYLTIVKPLGEETFEARGREEERFKMEQLSQGTKEQLFLAVRLGLVKEFGRKQEKLPLVMDDVLVNFDAQRARATANLLSELGQTHQVLLFTCHQETLELVREVAPKTQVFTLSDGTIQRE